MGLFLFILLVVTILILSSIMSGSEAAILSISLAKCSELANSRKASIKRRARRLLLVKENLQQYISTIVILNNLINIVGSVYIGFLATKLFGEVYLGIVSGALTFLIIIFSEIIPKIYGERYNEKISLIISGPLLFFTYALKPILYLLNLIVRIFVKNSTNSNVSEGEIKEMAVLGHKEGIINAYESDVISNVFKMNDTEAYDIMVPKSKVETIYCNDSFERIVDIVKRTGFTRFPVLKDEEVIGFINAKDLFKFYNKKEKFQIEKILRPIIYAPESMKIFVLEEKLKKERSHLAIIVNEHGDFTGIVTLEDIIEELLGEIEDEFDKDKEPTIKKINNNVYHIDASENIEEINDMFDLDIELDEEDFSTINGYLISEAGKIPKVNDKIKFKKGNFRVLKANRKKVLTVELFIKE